MIQAIKNFMNDIRKEHERGIYYTQCWAEGRWTSNSICYKIVFDNQRVMMDNNMLENNHGRDRFDYSSEFEDWLRENLRGYYNIRGWGNGRGNPNQVTDGIWHLEVHCMRKGDALAVKMRWKW